ncbi:MAG: signal peptidase II [Chitinispirillaceae bacterium]|nr:signal peptidase II [Chitinispirillaceae bacterium]
MLKSFLKYLLMIMLVVGGCSLDQMSKRWAVKNLKDKSTMIVVKNFLEFSYTENRGMVFGINNRSDNHISKNILLVIRILLTIGLTIFVFLKREKNLFYHFPFLLIIAGAFGNLIDLFSYGYVIDFIHMHAGKVLDWPFLYNLADAYVCIGMGILIFQSLFFTKEEKGSAVNEKS